MLKSVLFGGVALIMASAGPAVGADAPMVKARKPPAKATFYDWTGFYIGSHFGYASGYSRYSATEPGTIVPVLAGSLDLFKAFDGFKGTGSYDLGLHGGYG